MRGKYRIRIIDRYGEKRFYPEVKGLFWWRSITVYSNYAGTIDWALTETDALRSIEKHKIGVKVTDKYL